MLKLPTLDEVDRASGARVFLCLAPTDMRRSFDRLAETVRTAMGHDPAGGGLFVFRSKAGDRLKVLYFDRDGYALWYKRLEAGTFRFPAAPAGTQAVEVRPSELAMLLEGIDLRSVKRTARLAAKDPGAQGPKGAPK
jgi:transposase